jgi:ADP-ribose pyrophosphatase YjhB (NUDIX family)
VVPAGGALEVGERIAEAAVREVREETGIEIAITGLVGVYTSPRHVTWFSSGRASGRSSTCVSAAAELAERFNAVRSASMYGGCRAGSWISCQPSLPLGSS